MIEFQELNIGGLGCNLYWGIGSQHLGRGKLTQTYLVLKVLDLDRKFFSNFAVVLIRSE